ncbi:MAG: glycosyltransferase, partial [Caldilineaceae bacterium]|nr:glycosyltransferase [Caldilineaceae bacterium]
MALAIFWGAVSLIVYTYVLFPILTMIRGAFWPREHHSIAIAPSVSLIIAAYNEADSIRAKLENVLALVYPRDSFEVLVASDGSTDGTNEIVREYEDRGI